MSEFIPPAQENLMWQEALASQNEEVFSNLVEVMIPDIGRIAHRYAGDDSNAAEEASQIALGKIFTVFQGGRYPQPIIYPKTYFMRVAHNAISDYFGSKQVRERVREENINPKLLSKELKGIDESFPITDRYGRLLEKGENGGSGWRTFRIKEGSPPKKAKKTMESKPIHPLLRRSYESLYFYVGQTGYTLDAWSDALKRLNELRDSAKQAMLLVETMPGDVDRLILAMYLWGHKQVDIATRLGKQESNVSRRIKTWLARWHWDDSNATKIRLGILLHNLVDIGREAYRLCGRKGNKQYLKQLDMMINSDDRTKAWFVQRLGDSIAELDHLIIKLESRQFGTSLPKRGGYYGQEDWQSGENQEWPPRPP